MVDFKKLREAKAKPKPNSPRDIFNGLPRPPGINDLYASQAEVLDAWYPRRNERDVVIKLHTGGGKTLVALLMAQSIMNEFNEPVIYLAPTNQLVAQVLAKSREYGIAAVPYKKGEGFPPEFYDGKAVLVGAYETLFNGRSKFGIRNKPGLVKAGAIILDDAHVALSSVRAAFTLTIKADKHPDVFADLIGRFRTSFREIGRIGSFSDIASGKDFGVLEVPSWAWQQKLPEVQQYLGQVVEQIDPFIWPLIRDDLGVCHCLISGKSVTITPIFPVVDLLPTFEDCPRRIYMSATISDDSEIVRTFDADPDAVAKPITSQSLAGVGERMILIPELMKLTGVPLRTFTKEIAKHLSGEKQGVVILTPSGETANLWTDVASYPAKTQAVVEQIAEMQQGKTFGPIVLANRYDGIDLAGNSCRCLILDDLPLGTSDYDLFKVNVVADSAVSSQLAQRIEQGIGRGTRGGGDYCVVMLLGSKLVGWIGRKSNLAFLTASTRLQLSMGQEMSATVTTKKEMLETILKSLKRDPDWVSYHASEIADAAQVQQINLVALRVAGVERKAFRLQRLGQLEKAMGLLETLLLEDDLKGEKLKRAWLAASAARIAYQLNDNNRGQMLQTRAFSISNNHTPPKNRPPYVARPIPGSQATAIVSRLLEYDLRGAIIADYEEAISDLVPNASAAQYEEALSKLGGFLGFDADRPEKSQSKGPDVLWRTSEKFDFVIEAKSKKDGNPLYKNDHAQLLEAEAWFKETYPARDCVRISALPEAVADPKASTVGSYAIRLNDITKLAGALRQVLAELSGSDGNVEALRELCETALIKSSLKPEGIKKAFLVSFEAVAKKAV